MHSFNEKYRSLVYVRLDRRNGSGSDALNAIKAFLAAEFPVALGFPVPNSLNSDADVPYRPSLDSSIGGQAVVAVGYDDERLRTSKGALLFRSSWGSGWGEHGYGWLPYGYVEQQLATDVWVLLRGDWLATGEFRFPELGVKETPAETSTAGAARRPR